MPARWALDCALEETLTEAYTGEWVCKPTERKIREQANRCSQNKARDTFFSHQTSRVIS